MLQILRTMSGKKVKASQSDGLLKKLHKKGAAAAAPAPPSTVDIEDAADACVAKSPYFSPLQTRQQRKMKAVEVVVGAGMQKEKLVTSKQKYADADTDEPLVAIKMKPAAAPIAATAVKWMPIHWQQILENIRLMRAQSAAPVDTMGCHKCSDDAADEKTQRFHKLVALMLSSQTKDETTYAAMQRLKANALTPESIIAIDKSELEQLLHPVSFFKNKTKYLKETSQILVDKYDSDIPNNIKELVALPGVGPKMAHLCMSSAWNEVTGIGVDVHVHRITNRLRWLPKETKEPEQTRIGLEAWLPRELWSEVNHLLVGFGQTVCTPVRPHCGDCMNREICPSAEKQKKAVKQKQVAAGTASAIESDISPIKKGKFQKKKMQT